MRSPANAAAAVRTVDAASSSQMIAAVRNAAAAGLAVAVCAGSGSPAAEALRTHSPGGVLLIRTHRARAVQVDPARQVAWIQAGARWGDVLRASAPYGLAPVTGSPAQPAAVPTAISGGAGPLGRAWGFAADRVLRLAIVTADGQLRQASPDQSPELFAVVCGAGASFGVVTALEVRLVPLTSVYAGSVVFHGRDAAIVLPALGAALEAAPPGLGLTVTVDRMVDIRVCHPGDARDVRAMLSGLCAVAPLVADTTRERSVREVLAPGSAEPMRRGELRTATVDRGVPAVLAGIADQGGPGNPLSIEFTLLGGAMAVRPDHPDAVGQRSALGLMTARPSAAGAAGAAAIRNAHHRLLGALAPFGAGGTLPELLRPDPSRADHGGPNQTAASFGPVLIERLRAAKREWDPQAMFRFGPDLAPADPPAR